MPLAALLAARIQREGPMTFAAFMEAALYHPEHGYYASGRARIGRGGDYFTNVSVGPLFGRLLMRQFAEMWHRLGSPAEFAVIEQGAHGGDFAHDVLEGARKLEPAFFQALRYVIVEPLAHGAAAQRTRLASFGEKVGWRNSLTALEPFVGVHFSNELLDAFPVRVVRRVDDGWCERRVAWEDGNFNWADAPIAEDTLRARLLTLPEVPLGYQTEICLLVPEWVEQVAARLVRGWLLAVDYGHTRAAYYRPDRREGTLSAYAQHQRADDPLATPGALDLTAHVDFTALAEAACAAGCTLAGFTDQHHFITGLARLHFADTDEWSAARQKEVRAFQTLMHPQMLGSAFHAICFARGLLPAEPLSGFSFAQPPSL